ncbi:MAG: gliding motility-associated C-terminal domain-containing protein [Agriterribacter sp.]
METPLDSPLRKLYMRYVVSKTFCSKLAYIIVFLLFIFSSNTGYCQSPSIEWQKSLGGSDIERVYSIQQTTDGGYIVTGYSYSNDGDVSGHHGITDFWVVKLDATGAIQWQRSLGGSGDEYAYSIHQTADGGYIIAGLSGSNDGDVSGNHGGSEDCWIVKLDATGNIQWQKSLGGSADDRAASIQQTTDGGYIIAGISTSNNGDVSGNHGAIDCWIVKLDATGNIQWQKCLGGSNTDKATSVQQTADGGYIIGGNSRSNNGDLTLNHGDYDYWVVKLDAAGILQWQKSLGGSGTDLLASIQQTADGGYIVGGNSSSNDGDVTGNHGGSDYWVVKLGATGDIQWQKSLGGSGNELGYSILQSIDGGYVMAGVSRSNDGDVTGNHGLDDEWVVKLDATGNTIWQKCFGGSGGEDLRSIRQTADGGYILGGASGSNDGDVTGNHGNADFWIVKLCDLPPKPGAIVGNLSPCKGIASTYSISAVSGASSYTWTVPAGWAIVSGQSTTSISVTPGSSAGNITVTADNGCGSSTPQTLAVTVTAPLTPTINITSTSTTICSGSTITFTATATNGGTSPIYQWKKNGTNAGTNSATYTDATLINNDVITCELKSSETCVTSSTATSNTISISVGAPVTPTINITSTSTTICSGSSITFTATVTNEGATPVYQWRKNGTNVGVNSPTYSDALLNNSDVIICGLTSSETCVTSATATSNGITITTGTLITPAINITSTSTTICSGSSITFTATATNGGTSPIYQWKKNGTNTGVNSATYTDASLNNADIITCELTSNETCVTSSTALSNAITINVGSPLTPTINITSTSTTICSGSNITFTATATNSGTSPIYQWKKNGTIAGTNSATYTDASLNNNDIITCELTSSEACVTSATVTSNAITLTETANVSVNITASATTICKDDEILFIATAINGGATPMYQWKKNGVNVGSNSDTYTSNNLSDKDEVICTVIPQGNSCSVNGVSSNIISITINPLPIVNIIPGDTVVVPGSQVQLSASVSGNIISYEWSPVPGFINASILSPTTIPIKTETVYWLNIKSEDGCPVTSKITIGIYSKLLMPNAFTPNNDKLNDIFRIPPNAPLKLRDFSIYNRWGQRIFFTTDMKKGWDGANQPMGTYTYVINGSDNNRPVFLKGSVVLLR